MQPWKSTALACLLVATSLAACTSPEKASTTRQLEDRPLGRVVPLEGSVASVVVEVQPAESTREGLAALRLVAPGFESQVASGLAAGLGAVPDGDPEKGRAAFVVTTALRQGDQFYLYGVLYYRLLKRGDSTEGGDVPFRISGVLDDHDFRVTGVEVPPNEAGQGRLSQYPESVDKTAFHFSDMDRKRLLTER